ncbi:MAG: dienelactone hydrolase family protein [Candidatus Aminicenantes bacterium]|nr:dienelactone hydrolase family protein [Candidatus Aminicenantes bacterium]
MDKKYIDLYEKYRNGKLDRRDFLKKLAYLAGGAAAAVSVLPILEKNSIEAQVIAEDDPQLNTEYIQYPGETGDVRAYQACPKNAEKLPAVIVIHENRGLVSHIEDVVRRVALEGYFAIGPDAISPLGGTTKNADEDRARLREIDSESTIKNLVAAVAYLKTHPQTTGKVGCIGFCWGGGMTNQVAVRAPELTAAVPFYGSQPKPEEVPNIKAALLLHYAGLDERINAGISAFEAALKTAGIEYKMFMYEGAAHAFFNDTGSRYHKEASELAWKRTIEFLNKKLKT